MRDGGPFWNKTTKTSGRFGSRPLSRLFRGPEVAEAFRKRFGDRLEPVSDPSKAESVTGSCTRRVLTITAGNGDRSFVDLRKGCEVALSDSGLNEKNLEFLPYCTACHRDLFYSFRKGDTDKRQLAFIGVRL
ncbi:MAG: laccase domain-containing protein [Deltaproteobacteria bacterium]|nr:laccase domain-containing protein [Deltaproteobacteria bacterium]